MSYTSVEKNYVERTRKTLKSYPKLAKVCRTVLDSMWSMKDELRVAIRTNWGAQELPPFQQFVSIYFLRNLVYLRPIYLLGCEGSCSPAYDLQRTVYEMILRGYLFIANKDEANLFYSYIEGTITSEEKRNLEKRRFYPTKFLWSQLFEGNAIKSHENIWRELSRYSHASIRGAMRDLEEYFGSDVEDCLKMFLSLAYGNIQMMAEGFFDLLSPSLEQHIKGALGETAGFLGEVPLFEPDQERWSAIIKLRKGNFQTVL
jgi:hypothetical protein